MLLGIMPFTIRDLTMSARNNLDDVENPPNMYKVIFEKRQTK